MVIYMEDASKSVVNDDTSSKKRDTFLAWLMVVVFLLSTLILASTVGFGPYDEALMKSRAPTLWDWLELLIVPTILALGALWFNKTQKDTELYISQRARLADRENAEEARRTDQKIAENQQRQATLEAYYDRMTELLLDRDLRGASEGSEARSIARARTITVIRNLDGGRNTQLIAFLKTAKLIEAVDPIINLKNSDFTGADLSGANLSEVDLVNACLLYTSRCV